MCGKDIHRYTFTGTTHKYTHTESQVQPKFSISLGGQEPLMNANPNLRQYRMIYNPIY